jgi:hypothetical protein
MDPNATLKRILEARAKVKMLQKFRDDGVFHVDPEDLDAATTELADAVWDLHEWLSKNGALPDEWARYEI